jgi:hypothetical protein
MTFTFTAQNTTKYNIDQQAQDTTAVQPNVRLTEMYLLVVINVKMSVFRLQNHYVC